MIKHFDKLLPDWVHNKIKDQTESPLVDWHFPGNGLDLNASCFMHLVYDEERNYSDWQNLESLQYGLESWVDENKWFNIRKLNRCIVNFYTPNMTMGWHTDHQNPNYYTLIYYVNDSDGGTQVEDQTFYHKENSGIILNSNINHINITSQSPRRISVAWILEGYPNENI